MPDFFQDPPQLANQYQDDRLLRALLRRKLPPDVLHEIEPALERMGERAVGEIQTLGDRAEAEPPRHVPYDAWGRRIDDVVVSDAWKALGRIATEEGLVAIAYERAHGALSRLHQHALLYLFNPPSALYSCPLAMSDGAARALELFADAELKQRALTRLVSRDPHSAWTSGQWMTERSGGSDVSQTSTIARRGADGSFTLHGTKWFTSAVTSDMALTLARIDGAPAGSAGLSLFYLELRDAQRALQGIRVSRLKDKLGTRAVPTAELTLEGTPARLVGDAGHGVKKIAQLMNVTRIYNANGAVAGMRRGIALARDYAWKRHAFGKPIALHALHQETLADVEVELRAAFHLLFRAVELQGRDECNTATADERAILRLLTPILKLFTAKQGVAVASEVLEAFGGAGYVEDTGLPRLLRDAQVLPIWEGTTNVLALDCLRAIDRENALPPFLADIDERLASVTADDLATAAGQARQAARELGALFERTFYQDRAVRERAGRHLAFGLARTYAAALLLDHAEWAIAHEDHDAANASFAAKRWCRRPLVPPRDALEVRDWEAHHLALGALHVEEVDPRTGEPLRT